MMAEAPYATRAARRTLAGAKFGTKSLQTVAFDGIRGDNIAI